ncbi:MAG: GNAT family N-acetyltransferase [Candidatus Obscuribacterales bacterium]|nr:GNAT family N-acetyltransferase [Candidatus Obscuribacterales bacterium]
MPRDMQENTNIVIEPMRSESLPQVIKLWDLSFGPPYNIQSASDYAKKHLSLLLTAYDKDKVAAVAGILDFDLHFAGQWTKTGGIAGVATHPSYRRQGLTRRLLEAALKELYNNRVPLATLWPFSYRFYENFGWSVSDVQYKIEQNIASLPQTGKASNYQEIPAENHSQVHALHDAWCEKWNLSMRRAKKRWSMLLSKPGASWLLLKHQAGYMLINLRDADQGTLIIREWCYLSQEAFADGLAWLAQMDSQFKKVRFLAAETDSLFSMGIPHSPAEIIMQPGMMSRVVHPEAFAELLPKPLSGIQIMDPLGVSSSKEKGEAIGPGELVQLVSGFFKEPANKKLAHLHAIAGMSKTFSVEKY